jgi:asparagine synthetase B (glutamine-hydrolysing)
VRGGGGALVAPARASRSRTVNAQAKKQNVKKVVLAYSGGLDTSVILKWLQDEYNCEVVTFTADLGQVCSAAAALVRAWWRAQGAATLQQAVISPVAPPAARLWRISTAAAP